MNCKPGDLAVVVRARNTPELTGRIVRVIRSARPDDRFEGRGWRPTSEAAWVVTSEGTPLPWRLISGSLIFVASRPVCDFMLRPIRGDESADTTTASETLPKALRTDEKVNA